MIRRYGGVAILSVLLLCSLCADNWPGWRGPGNLGISAEQQLPLEWGAQKNVRWKVPLHGAGVSTPVVWNERIFLTASDGRLNDRLHVLCYHRDDGRLLWHSRLFGTAPTDLYAPGGMAVSTPATNGKALYVLFGTGELAALDFEGHPLWIRSLAQEYGPFRNRWGLGTSPILADGTLYVQIDHWSQSYLLAIDPATGANRWKADRPAAVNWTSPLAVRVQGRREIITFGTRSVRSYDATDGKELWHVNGMGEQCIPSPLLSEELLLACSGDNTLAIRLDGGQGDLTRSNVAWVNKKASAFVPTPLLYQGLLYIPGSKGFITCLDPRTGKEVYKDRLGGQFEASPVGGAGRIYLASKEGVVSVLRAGARFEVLASNDMGEMLVASPALADGRLYLRGEKHLFCIGDGK
jgi:outer membrane protein assembly factor BamB